MGDAVNGITRRPATRRGAQARATRRRIVAAAAELFIENGYPATTLDQIADRAGVAVQTVYFHFGNKRTVLKEAVDVAAVGDEESVPLLERPWMEQIRGEPDPHRVVALWVQTSRTILGRIAPIMRVVRDAAAGDPDVADQWTTSQQQRDTAFRLLARLLADRGDLRPGLSVQQATDIVFALLSIELYLLLTATRGWTPEHWERWTIATLDNALLP
jgi:AcrR family transcriptional regulator